MRSTKKCIAAEEDSAEREENPMKTLVAGACALSAALWTLPAVATEPSHPDSEHCEKADHSGHAAEEHCEKTKPAGH